MFRSALPLALVLLAGCARSEEANLLPVDSNGARSVESVRPERDDELPALGQWRETLQDEQRAIEFGPSGAAPLFSLACDARRGLLLQRNGLEPTGDLPVMLVTVGSETRRLAVARGEGPLPLLRASLNPSDQLAILFGRAAAPIEVRIGDSPPLILPPSPLIGAYISQCQNGILPAARGSAGNTSAPAAGNSAAPAGRTAGGNVADAGD